jgi:hypothetical protein
LNKIPKEKDAIREMRSMEDKIKYNSRVKPERISLYFKPTPIRWYKFIKQITICRNIDKKRKNKYNNMYNLNIMHYM